MENQEVKPKEPALPQQPSIETQLEFVRGARHLVKRGEVTFDSSHHAMFVALEETLMSSQMWRDLLEKTVKEGSKEIEGSEVTND
jgi:hypothetical protein